MLPNRIESKIDRIPFSGCWLWIGAGIRYGNVQFNGRISPAHRVVWELTHGSIPVGMELMHRCDVGCCVNPDHLQIGSHLENMQDMVSKGRQKAPSGSSHWTKKHPEKARLVAQANITNSHGSREENNNAKVTHEIVCRIRSHYKTHPNLTMTKLGEMFGLKREQTRKIVKGLAWK